MTPAHTIQMVVCDRYGLTHGDMVGPSRAQDLTDARHIAIAAVREITGLSMPKIGRQFGDRHHTSILHALNRVEEKQADPDFSREWHSVLTVCREVAAPVFRHRKAVAFSSVRSAA